MNGYAGRILHVDLSQSKIEIETPAESFYRKFVGGSAMGMAYILKETKPGVDPLGSENVLTLMIAGPTGAPISGQSRMAANARSPLVDGIGDAQCGGFFPAELKFAGFDGIVVKGRASRPVYLWVHEGQAELRDASALWGKPTAEVDALLKAELGDEKVEIAQCGPAGEKCVRLAAIINMANRANGRTGLGAVMGSKLLKAVVVRGRSKKIQLADGRGLNVLARRGAAEIENNADVSTLKEYGTAGVVGPQNASGTLPTYNYNAGQFEHYDSITGETMKDTILKESDTCYACAVRCKRVVESEWRGRPIEARYGGPEYETIGTLGSYCGVDDLKAIALANQLCNAYGLDTIGTGATIAWAMECYENGLLSESEVGFPLKFGDAAAVVKLVEMIGQRQGFGDILAEGSRRAADRLGKGHPYLITCKGSEAPAHMPQAKRSLALIYAVNPFGADHQSSEHDPMIEEGASDFYLNRLALLGFHEALPPMSLDERKVRFALQTEKFYSFLDSACLCQFVCGPAWNLYGPAEVVEIIRLTTGWQDFDLEELLEVGERRLTMLRAFNAREGLTRAQDVLPTKFFKPLQGTGPTAGIALERDALEKAKDIYYSLLGWDVKTGNPTPEKLAALGIEM